MSEDQWNEEFNPDNVELSSKLDILVSSFNTELKQVYDTMAPEKESKVNLRLMQLLYDDEMKQLKRRVCMY